MGRHTTFRELSDAEFLAHAATADRGLSTARWKTSPADRVRMHICWGNYEGPHHRDIPLAAIFDEVMKAKPHGPAYRGIEPAP